MKEDIVNFLVSLIAAAFYSLPIGLIIWFMYLFIQNKSYDQYFWAVEIIVFLVTYYYFVKMISIRKLEEQNKKYEETITNYEEYILELKKITDEKIKNTKRYSAEMSADLKTISYDLAAKYLENKKRPAIREAQRIKDLKQETKEYVSQYKLMKYEYDYLFSLFPELENYIDTYDEQNTETLKELKDNYDYVRSWVSKEEYINLSENERNQLALERYISSRKKNNWQIGRDYEMYIGHKYEEIGYKVQYTGIIKRLEDMGRDLIAVKDDDVLIIQCKYWSKNKIIHENHICQLFGTTIQYNIENNCNAKPIFVTSTSLSETAQKFAKYLNIEVIENEEISEFPRIKCNIGKDGEKIYHLPFDQQYDKTIIGDRRGEFFAWNVEEAAKKGFRRAKKYFYN